MVTTVIIIIYWAITKHNMKYFTSVTTFNPHMCFEAESIMSLILWNKKEASSREEVNAVARSLDGWARSQYAVCLTLEPWFSITAYPAGHPHCRRDGTIMAEAPSRSISRFDLEIGINWYLKKSIKMVHR